MRMTAPIRRSTNVSIDAALLDEAKALDLNLSRAGEAGIRAAVKAEKERRWLEENAMAIEYANRWVAENGLPGRDIRAWR
jgi:antitoxin CcdA